MIRQDYIKRHIEQLGAAIARLLGQQAPAEQVLLDVEQAKRALPVVPGILDTLPASAVVELLGSPELARQFAELLRLEASALKQLNRTGEAAARLRKSLDLLNLLTEPPRDAEA